jgi:hypothetical protein
MREVASIIFRIAYCAILVKAFTIAKPFIFTIHSAPLRACPEDS